MVKNTVQLYIKGDPDLISSLAETASQQTFQITRPISLRGDPTLVTAIATLGSAGAFTAFIQVIKPLLFPNKDRELVLERKGARIVLKGHSLTEEKEIIGSLAPELLQANIRPNRKGPER